jgi:PAS domain S-box-containing protein
VILQDLKLSTHTAATEELTGRSVTIFFEPDYITLTGRWFWDFASDAIYCSNVMLPFPDSVIGTKGIIHPDDVDRVREKLQWDEVRQLEFRIITTYGEVKKIVGEAIKVHSRAPFTVATESRLQEISAEALERKELEHLSIFKQVRESADRITSTGVWWYNNVTTETWYSAEVFRIYELAPFSLNPHLNTFISFIHPEDRDVVEDYVNLSHRNHTPLHIEYRILTSAGEKHVQHISDWIFLPNGETVISGMLRDITAEKTRERELDDLEQNANFLKHQLLFDEDNNTTAHWYVNLITRKSVFSNNYYRLFGIKAKAIVELSGFYEYVHPDDREPFRQAVRKMLHQHTAPELEFRIYRADGKLRYLAQRAKLFSQGNDIVMMGVLQDVTIEVLLKKKIKELTDSKAVRSFAQGQSEAMAEMAGWVWNTSNNSIKWSENFYNLLGVKPGKKEITHQFFLSLVHPEDQKMFKDHMNLLMQQRQESTFDMRLLQWGKTKYLRASFRMMKHEGEELFIAIFRDVTKERQLEEELQQRVQVAETLSDNILDRILITDIHYTIKVWNRACEEAYGHGLDEVMGKNFFDIFPKLKTEEEISYFYRVLKGERIFLKANRAVTSRGYFDVYLLPMWNNERSEVNGIVHILHDVTHETELERNLNERFTFIESLVESSPDYIIALDRNMNYMVWNKKCEEYYRLKKEQVIGKNLLEVFPSAHNTPAYEHFRRVLKGETIHIPATTEGSRHETYLLPVKNEKNDIQAILWIEHDLTNEIDSEKSLREQAHLLQTVFNATLDGIVLFKALHDEQGAISDYQFLMNNAVTRAWNGKDMIGEKYVENFPNVKTSGLFDAFNKVMETGEPLDTEIFYHGEGFENWFRIKAVRLSADQLVSTAEDVTEKKKADEEAKKHLAVLQNAEQLVKMGSWEYDIPSGKFTWSDGMYSMFGLPKHMIVHPEIYLDSAVEEDRSVAKRIVSNLKKKHQAFEEVMKIRKGKEQRLLKIKASVVADQKGNPQKVIGVDIDVTDIQKVEDQLKESQHWLQQTAKASPDSITIYDLQKKQPIYLNDCLAEWTGVSNSGLVEMGIEGRLKLVHEDDRLHLLHFNEKIVAAKDGEVMTMEYRVKTPDDRIIWLRNRSKPFQREASGKVTHLLSILQNVTEEVELREQLKERTQFAEAILDASVDRITVFDRNYRFVGWNRRCEQIHNKTREEVIGKTIFEIFPGVENYPDFNESQKKAVRGEFVHVPVVKDGLTGDDLELFYIPLKNEAGETYAVVNLMHDVSDYVLSTQALNVLNQKLESKNHELEQKNEEITSFAFVASHDMKEPLRKIHTFSEWLIEQEAGQLSPKGKNLAEKINASVHRMEILLEDILVLTKIHSDTHKEENVDLNEVLKQVIDEMSDWISQTATTIQSDVLPRITANSNQLFYLFKNLISNAIKFQRPGSVPHLTVKCDLVKGAEVSLSNMHDQYLKLSFVDNGFGFDPRYTKKIFQVFQRLHGKNEFEGTGIGLAICKKIMENHGGVITVDSEEGKGSAFNCFFPAS